jgi:hypothetical protein
VNASSRRHFLQATILAGLLSLTTVPSARSAPSAATLEDLKKLPIICLVPAWLPDGYRLRTITIDREDRDGLKDPKQPGFPAYNLEYTNGKKGSFTVECARWGIGDRNLDEDENAEESEFATKSFGKVYIIYLPKGKTGVKKRIVANWIADKNWRAEEAKHKDAMHLLGRVHGVSGFGMTLAEFEKIVQSLHPVGDK